MSIGIDGRIRNQGSLSDALEADHKLAEDLVHEKNAIDASTQEHAEDEVKATIKENVTSKPSNGKLILAEEKSEGHLGWPSSMFKLELGG